jgi:hypothetical protein
MRRPQTLFQFGVCIALVATMLLAACGGESSRRSPSAPPNLSAPATLVCKECVDAGILQANIFGGPDLNALACRERWGTRVQILDTSTTDGVPIYQVKTPSCTGWVSSRLVQR